MYIGLGIVLLVLGLIFATGVITVDLQGIDDSALGVILIIGGIIAIALSLYMAPPAWRRSTTVVRERPVVRERRYYEDEPPM